MKYAMGMGSAVLLCNFVVGCGAATGAGDAPAADGVQGTVVQGATLLLRDDFSPSARLIVSENAFGDLDVSIQGAIGVEDPGIVPEILNGTLAQAYVRLHPTESSVPEKVQAVSDRWQAQRERDRALVVPPARGADLPVEQGAVQAKDFNSFNANACQRIYASFGYYSPMQCPWTSTQKQIQTAYNMVNTDLSAAWNENQWPATHWMSIQGLSQITVPAYWWNYTTWSGTWSGAASFLTTECGSACKAASLGVTRHEYHATPH